MYAIHNYNGEGYYPQLTLLDACILALIKSYHDSGATFYMTNNEIAKVLLSSVNAVKSSLDRLQEAGLIAREKHWDAQSGRSVRTITIDKYRYGWLTSLLSNVVMSVFSKGKN